MKKVEFLRNVKTCQLFLQKSVYQSLNNSKQFRGISQLFKSNMTVKNKHLFLIPSFFFTKSPDFSQSCNEVY